MIRRLLIANRGEIARRIIRTCRSIGVETVAVYSEADRDAPFVYEADEAVAIGPPPATESYLNIDTIIAAARSAGADAIHPGYGFLSERAEFVDACEAAHITFVGPPASVMRRMGSKAIARATMEAAGVPVVPGAVPASQTHADIAAAVMNVGLPCLLKAASGGGGKGMRIVRDTAEIDSAIDAAKQESQRAFGNDALYVERLITHARHIEVQVFGDRQGHVVHVLERDCTLQRRHQKVIEEAPAPGLSDAVRTRLRAAAVTAARAIGYVNAGTVEFLLAGEGDAAEFYFLEMNMRLQVEHPVTEAITGLDLVRAQLYVAAGEALPFAQEDIAARGCAIEARVYAEDPRRLLPQAGRLLRYREPHGNGVRIDSGVVEGQHVTVHYDPLLAKVIALAPTRTSARDRLLSALREFEILGLRHNLAFLAALLARPELDDLRVHTRFIEEHLEQLLPPPSARTRRAAAAIAAFVASRGERVAPAVQPGGPNRDAAVDPRPAWDPWAALGPVSW